MPKKKKLISIGIICHNEELNIALAYKELTSVSAKNKNYNYQFIYTDNGSTDGTRREIRKITRKDKRVIGVCLSRNFGPEASGQAALDFAKGDAFIMYEGDRQDPPDVINEFIKKWEQGYDAVVGIRTKTEEASFMAFIRRTYYKIFKAISNIEVPTNAGSFCLMDKKVYRAMQSMPEKHRFFRGLRAWVGFRTAYVTYHRRKREHGKSSYNIFRYIHLAERSFFGFSYFPLDIMIYTGLLLVCLSFLAILIYLLIVVIFTNAFQELVLLLLSVVFFGGVQLLALSIIGKYIQVIMEETKSRPIYILEEAINYQK